VDNDDALVSPTEDQDSLHGAVVIMVMVTLEIGMVVPLVVVVVDDAGVAVVEFEVSVELPIMLVLVDKVVSEAVLLLPLLVLLLIVLVALADSVGLTPVPKLGLLSLLLVDSELLPKGGDVRATDELSVGRSAVSFEAAVDVCTGPLSVEVGLPPEAPPWPDDGEEPVPEGMEAVESVVVEFGQGAPSVPEADGHEPEPVPKPVPVMFQSNHIDFVQVVLLVIQVGSVELEEPELLVLGEAVVVMFCHVPDVVVLLSRPRVVDASTEVELVTSVVVSELWLAGVAVTVMKVV
jgi:hypothetical protein